jgi:O-antigen/teichoic acid export membrane protein
VLTRQVSFQRIAILNVTTTIIASGVTLLLAWQGFGVWSLVASDIAGALILVLGYYGIRPVWIPRFGWSPGIVKYYIGFGRRTFLAGILLQALDRVDDLWTGFALGDTALGFYSRAYRFAAYPRSILAEPIGMVVGASYAELKARPKQLSQAFFRTNALLIRSGFLMAGLLALVAPEFIRIVLGARWLPMLTAFRFMLIFTLLDPIKSTIASVFVAVGRPEKVVRARLVQLAVLVIGLITLGSRWGISGVAVAVDIMLVVGIAILLWQARAYVKFSIWRLFAAPATALLLGMIVGRAVILVPGIQGSPWRTGSAKTLGFMSIYAAATFLLEREVILEFAKLVKQSLWGRIPRIRDTAPDGPQSNLADENIPTS